MTKTIVWGSALCALAAAPPGGPVEQKASPWAPRPSCASKPADANVNVRAANVKTIEAHVYTTGWRIGPGDVHVIDHQTGDHVDIEVKVPQLHFNFGNRSVKIELQIPATTKIDVLHRRRQCPRRWPAWPRQTGDLDDGNIDGEGFEGTLDASSGDGNIHVRGKFSAPQPRAAATAISRRRWRPGRIWHLAGPCTPAMAASPCVLPDGFAANLDAHTGDGHITVDLPVTAEGGIHEDSVSGKLNGGGPVLTVRTGDGSVHLARL